jgi:uncharacterized protein YigA (DUF484 family)
MRPEYIQELLKVYRDYVTEMRSNLDLQKDRLNKTAEDIRGCKLEMHGLIQLKTDNRTVVDRIEYLQQKIQARSRENNGLQIEYKKLKLKYNARKGKLYNMEKEA